MTPERACGNCLRIIKERRNNRQLSIFSPDALPAWGIPLSGQPEQTSLNIFQCQTEIASGKITSSCVVHLSGVMYALTTHVLLGWMC